MTGASLVRRSHPLTEAPIEPHLILCSMVGEIWGFAMRTRIVPSLVAVLAMVAASCGGSGDSESRSQTGSVAGATNAPAADTAVPSSDDSTPPSGDLELVVEGAGELSGAGEGGTASAAADNTSIPTATVGVEPSAPGTISVDAATAPPLVVPDPLVAIPLAPNPNGNRISVAIGPTSVAVLQPATDVVTLIHLGADVDVAASVRDVGIDEQLYSIVLGPGDVLYGFGDAPIIDNIPDARYVAIPLSGERAGSVVAEVSLSWLQYTELPPGAFGHGPDGVIDRDRDVNSTVIGYVDVDGAPVEWSGPAPPLLTFETDLGDGGRVSVVGSDLAWNLAIKKSPDHGGDYVGPSPPAPTSRGRVIYTDTIGPDLSPDQDFGPNQMPVVAVLEPDGSGRWIRLPDDWSVAASDMWGTVLIRTTDDSIEVALLDDALAAIPADPSMPTD